MKKIFLPLIAGTVFFASCGGNGNDKQHATADTTGLAAFLNDYTVKFKDIVTRVNDAEWVLNTHIVEGDTVSARNSEKVKQELADFTGAKEYIEKAQNYLKAADILDVLTKKQLEHILYYAAANPSTQAELVKEKIKEETAAVEKLYGFDYKIDGKSVTTNDIDGILKKENNVAKRQAAWETSKEVGKGLKPSLVKLRELRNKTVQGMNYADYFAYQVSDYGMTTDEMMKQLRDINKEIYPLYRELHTYARYELAARYGVKDVPDYLPAHWLPNRWGQDWSSIVDVKGFDLDEVIKAKGDKWVVEQAERFYVSLGFPELPKSFYEKSDLYPLAKDAKHKKNNHASAWHMDLDNDVRSLMSVEPNSRWYETTHHELGHIYYYLSYSRPEVPVMLREGANRAYHESLGSLMGMAAMQKPFVAGLGLVDANVKTDTIRQLLKEALQHIVALNWQAGTMCEFEYELYAKNLPENEFNKRWWEIVKREQGIVPPTERGEEYCDASTKTHIMDDPAQYYDYALASVMLFQFHDHIATNILKQDVHNTNYYGNKQIGEFIGSMMKQGSTGDWRQMLKDKTGSELSAKAMLKYFEPLMSYLKEVNKGRKYTLPETRG